MLSAELTYKLSFLRHLYIIGKVIYGRRCLMELRNIRYIVLDVDGTMTDGGIYYDETGNEFKKFSVRDAAGIWAAQRCGVKIIILTGRECQATTRRMKELKVDFVFQNIKNKRLFFLDFMELHKIKKENVVYIGDDLNDVSIMRISGTVGCPADACEEVKEIADYISKYKGGYGAVRDIIRSILIKENMWEQVIEDIYG